MRVAALLMISCLAVAALPAQDNPYNEFATKLAQAVEHNDTKNLDRAVRSAPQVAAKYFNDVAWTWRSAQDERNRQLMDAIKASWARTFAGSETLEKVERYLTSIDETTGQLVIEAQRAFLGAWNHYNEAKKLDSREEYLAAHQGAVNVAKTFEQLGHGLYAAECWDLAQQIANNTPDKTIDDRRDAIFASEQFMAARKSWEFTEDTLYKQHGAWLKAEQGVVRGFDLEAEKRAEAGYSADAKGADALVLPNATEQVVELQYETMKDLHPSPFARAGVAPALWLATQVRNTGPTQMPWFKGTDLYMVRAGANKYGLTTDGGETDLKKNPWQEIETSARFKPSLFYLDTEKKRPYSMWFYVGSEQETLFGLQQNLAPQPEVAAVYYRSTASWKGTINDVEVTFFDDNCNGQLFEQDPLAFGLVDRALGEPETRVPAFDSMSVGGAPPQPWTSFCKIGEKWFHLRGKGDRAVGARELNPEFFKTGSLQLKWVGDRRLKPEVLVFRGTESPFDTACYDLASAKPIEVPVGSYALAFGRIVSGKGARAMEAQVLAGSLAPVKVAAGETATVTLGGPFKLDFAREGSETEVIVDAMKMFVVGVGGERYARINGAAPAPEVLFAKTENGKGAKPIGEFAAMDIDVFEKAVSKFDKLRIEVGFFPVVKGSKEADLQMKLPLPGQGFVGLREKKNKLFGKLDPIFK